MRGLVEGVEKEVNETVCLDMKTVSHDVTTVGGLVDGYLGMGQTWAPKIGRTRNDRTLWAPNLAFSHTYITVALLGFVETMAAMK